MQQPGYNQNQFSQQQQQQTQQAMMQPGKPAAQLGCPCNLC